MLTDRNGNPLNGGAILIFLLAIFGLIIAVSLLGCAPKPGFTERRTLAMERIAIALEARSDYRFKIIKEEK